MDNLMQILFNTNHEMPSLPVVLTLMAIAIVVPGIMRYMQGRKEANAYKQERKGKKSKK